jgi:Rad3-related DNA helicase
MPGKRNITLDKIRPEGAAALEGSLKPSETLVRVNGEEIIEQSVGSLADQIRHAQDPLLLDVTQDPSFVADDTGYATHSVCPYYLSRVLAKHAELTFAPYNYVLDPFIRKSLDIDLSGTVVVLDEAHNVEDTLREGGSGKYSEFEMCEIVVMLSHFSSAQRGKFNQVELSDGNGEGETKDVSDIAHELLLFMEKLITFLIEAKIRFEQNPGTSMS